MLLKKTISDANVNVPVVLVSIFGFVITLPSARIERQMGTRKRSMWFFCWRSVIDRGRVITH